MNVERPDHLTEAQLHGAAEGSLASEEARLDLLPAPARAPEPEPESRRAGSGPARVVEPGQLVGPGLFALGEGLHRHRVVRAAALW